MEARTRRKSGHFAASVAIRVLGLAFVQSKSGSSRKRQLLNGRVEFGWGWNGSSI
jgi:hypothetical protein